MGAPDAKEGDARPLVAVVIEFPRRERLQAFYDADDYKQAQFHF